MLLGCYFSRTTCLTQSGNKTFVLTSDRRVVSRGFKETLIFIIVWVGHQESRLIPSLHRGRGDVESFANLCHGEHTTISQTIIARGKTIGFLDITDIQPDEGLAVNRMHSLMAQDSGDLAVCIIVEQSIDFGHAAW